MPRGGGGGGGGYGAYNAYISAATRYAALGAPTLYDHPGSVYGSMSPTVPLFHVMLGLGKHCYDDLPCHWIRKGISRDGKKDFCW